jgi:predicted NBD/HSP70 family sugar kinase
MSVPRSSSATAADLSLIRRVNSRVTLDALRAGEVLTLTALGRAVGLSRSTLEEVLPGLADRGLVEELPPARRGGSGRPARRFRFRGEAGYLAGVGIDMSRIRVRLCDLAGRTVCADEVVVDFDEISDGAFVVVRDIVAKCLKRAGVPGRLLRAVSVGVPGVVDPAGVIRRCVLPKHWEGVDLGGQLQRHFGCAALVENQGALAVLAELWQGAAVGAANVISVVTGIKFAVGITVNGECLRGQHGAAGEIGHIRQFGLPSSSGYSGLLAELHPGVPREQAASRVALAAAAGDPRAESVVAEYAAQLAPALAALVLTVDPELVVVGGAFAEAGDSLMAPLQREVNRLTLFPVTMARSTLGGDAIVIGAVRRALDHAEATVLDLVG